MNEHLCQLIAMLMTDGSVSPHSITSWEINFRNKSEQLNELFNNLIYSLFKIIPNFQVKPDGTKNYRFRSKDIGEELLKLTNTYRTLACRSNPICGLFRNSRQPCLTCLPYFYNDTIYPTMNFPAEIEKNLNYARLFLKTAFSCDGGVSLYEAHRGNQSWLVRKVFIDSKHPIVREFYKKLLEKLGFHIKVYGNQIRIQEYEIFKKFRDKIGFIDGVRIGKDSKYWVDTTKNELLNYLLSSYRESPNG